MTRAQGSGARLAAVAGVALWFATLTAQNADPLVLKGGLVSSMAAGAIDTGLRAEVPPRARAAADARVRARTDASRFVPGSLIVKFRPGTSPQARQR